jgi:hypothetical protein
MNLERAPTDAAKLVKSLDADEIARRLEELADEERALRVLLRSARARENAVRRRRSQKGGGHAR